MIASHCSKAALIELFIGWFLKNIISPYRTACSFFCSCGSLMLYNIVLKYVAYTPYFRPILHMIL